MLGSKRSTSLLWLSSAPIGIAVLIAAAIAGADRGVVLVSEPVTLTRWPAALLVLTFGGAVAAAIRCAASALKTRQDARVYSRRLAESQAWTAVVLETAVEGIITFDVQGRIESFNRAAERIFGYSAEEVIGRNISMLMPAPDGEQQDDYVAHHWRTGRSKGIGLARERHARRKDGAVFPLEVAVSEVQAPDRRLFAGICHDISKRKSAEEALVASRSFLQTVVDEIPDSVMVIDRNYQVVLANRAVREAAGDNDPVANSLTCYQASHHRDTPCDGQHVCPLEQVIATKTSMTVTHTHFNAAGAEMLVEIIAAPILDEAGEVVQVIEASRDVTDRVRAENQARQRLAELAHLARLGTMGEMVAELAHELNQPLAAIVNYMQASLERIRAGVGDPGGLLEDLEAVAVQAERAGDIIEHVRAFVRKTDLKRSRADLNELVREALGLLSMEIQQRKVALHLKLCESLPEMHVVPIQIEQVIVNLIQNALDAMDGVRTSERRLTILTSADGNGGVELSVGDTGAGLSAADAERAFDPFFTTKADGMGMGLSMCRSIVEAHGGNITVVSAPNKGATIRITLPAGEGCGDDER